MVGRKVRENLRPIACEMEDPVSRGLSVDIPKFKTGLIGNLPTDDKLIYYRKYEAKN